MTDISNTADQIDSRAIIERIAEIEADYNPDGEVISLASMDKDAREEYTALLDLQEQGRGFDDWGYGNTLISVDYFETYAKELVFDLGMLPDDMPDWLINNIDWSGVADDLAVDYTQIDYDGNSYYIR